jgi:ubiquinone/menaquinone biosynthesis C-methylase UbiE
MAQQQTVDYDSAAGDYATHRQIHRGVARSLSECGRLGSGCRLLEVGCGTGSYVSTLTRWHGCAAVGLDPSPGMLAQARARPEQVDWVLGKAESLGFGAASFDLLFSVDVIHHVARKADYCHEIARVLRPGGYACTVTDSAEIIRRREILSGYFPETVRHELARYPRISQLLVWMAAAGLDHFESVTVEEPYQVTSALAYRQKVYSSLHLISEEGWRAGLERLERDLGSGPVKGVARYVCVWARRP